MRLGESLFIVTNPGNNPPVIVVPLLYTCKELLKNYFQPRSEKSQLQRSCEEVGFPMKESYIHTVHERKISSWELIHSLHTYIHTYIQYIVLTFYSVWAILFAFLSLCFASAATRCQLVVATAFFYRHSTCGWNISFVYVCMYVCMLSNAPCCPSDSFPSLSPSSKFAAIVWWERVTWPEKNISVMESFCSMDACTVCMHRLTSWLIWGRNVCMYLCTVS